MHVEKLNRGNQIVYKDRGTFDDQEGGGELKWASWYILDSTSLCAYKYMHFLKSLGHPHPQQNFHAQVMWCEFVFLCQPG